MSHLIAISMALSGGGLVLQLVGKWLGRESKSEVDPIYLGKYLTVRDSRERIIYQEKTSLPPELRTSTPKPYEWEKLPDHLPEPKPVEAKPVQENIMSWDDPECL